MGCTGSKSSEVASKKQEQPSGGLKNPVSSSNGTTKNISSIPAESNDEASMNHVPDIITISDKNENVVDEAGNRNLAQINEEETGNEEPNDEQEDEKQETGEEKKESDIRVDDMNSRKGKKETSSKDEEDTGTIPNSLVDFASRLCNSLFFRLIPSGNHFLFPLNALSCGFCFY